MGRPLTVGMVGVGTISRQYFDTIARMPGLDLVAVADLDAGRATAAATEHGVEALALEELFADPRIDAVLNLTVPAAHVEVALRAIEAGKHVYGEKPLALDLEGGRHLLSAAQAAGVRLGSAPDTVLGTGIQTARRLLDDGAIGRPVGAAVHWSSPGHESWHPAPQFYYQPGGGPLFDMGPYYLTSLVTLLGPVVRVSGSATRSDRARVVADGPAAGSPVPVDVDTQISAIVEHADGIASTLTMSFEIWASRAPQFEVFGTAGTIAVPDPNQFSEPVELWTQPLGWSRAADSAGYVDAGRGIGLADLAGALRRGEPHRASAEMAFHVLEIMDAILRSSREHRTVELTSTVRRPAPVGLAAEPDAD